MKTVHILLLCIVGAALLSSVSCNSSAVPQHCCFSFYPKRVHKNFISSYHRTDERCAMTGVILVTQKHARVCADPNLSWVQDIMKALDQSSF